MLNAERLTQIRERLNAATPGPWFHGDRWHVQSAARCRCEGYGPIIYDGQMSINGKMMRAHVHEAEEPLWGHGIYAAPREASDHHPSAIVYDTEEYGYMRTHNAELIANAPTDLRDLLDENERLRGVLNAIVAHLADHDCSSSDSEANEAERLARHGLRS